MHKGSLILLAAGATILALLPSPAPAFAEQEDTTMTASPQVHEATAAQEVRAEVFTGTRPEAAAETRVVELRDLPKPLTALTPVGSGVLGSRSDPSTAWLAEGVLIRIAPSRPAGAGEISWLVSFEELASGRTHAEAVSLAPGSPTTVVFQRAGSPRAIGVRLASGAAAEAPAARWATVYETDFFTLLSPDGHWVEPAGAEAPHRFLSSEVRIREKGEERYLLRAAEVEWLSGQRRLTARRGTLLDRDGTPLYQGDEIFFHLSADHVEYGAQR